MHDARIRLSRIGGALVAIGIVLGVALHLAEQSYRSELPAIAEVGLPAHSASAAPGLVAMATLLETHDLTHDGRLRIKAYALVPHPAPRSHIENELRALADAIARDHPGLGAVMIHGYRSEAEARAVGEGAARWTLTWSPDGRGWDGAGQDDFDKHLSQPR